MHSAQGCDRNTGLDCLVMLARYYQCPVSPEQLRHELSMVPMVSVLVPKRLSGRPDRLVFGPDVPPSG